MLRQKNHKKLSTKFGNGDKHQQNLEKMKQEKDKKIIKKQKKENQLS